MLIRHAMIPGEKGFVMQDVRLQDGRVTHVAGEIAPCAGERTLEMQGDYLLPGFVDVHIHGCMGADVMQGEAALRRMSRALYGMGVSSFLPTTMSAPEAETRRAVAAVRAVMDAPEPKGARVLGLPGTEGAAVTDGRFVVAVDGVPVGWAQPHGRELEAFTPGG